MSGTAAKVYESGCRNEVVPDGVTDDVFAGFFDLQPGAIIRRLDLTACPIGRLLAAYGASGGRVWGYRRSGLACQRCRKRGRWKVSGERRPTALAQVIADGSGLSEGEEVEGLAA